MISPISKKYIYYARSIFAIYIRNTLLMMVTQTRYGFKLNDPSCRESMDIAGLVFIT